MNQINVSFDQSDEEATTAFCHLGRLLSQFLKRQAACEYGHVWGLAQPPLSAVSLGEVMIQKLRCGRVRQLRAVHVATIYGPCPR